MPLNKKRLTDMDDRELMQYVEARHTRMGDDEVVGEMINVGTTEFTNIRFRDEDEEPPPLKRRRRYGTFRIRADDALNAFDRSFGRQWNYGKMREDFMKALEEHIDSYIGEKALKGLANSRPNPSSPMSQPERKQNA